MAQVTFGKPNTRDFYAGEEVNLKSHIIGLLGEDWLRTRMVSLGMRSPEDLIGTDQETAVHDLLLSLSVSALS